MSGKSTISNKPTRTWCTDAGNRSEIDATRIYMVCTESLRLYFLGMELCTEIYKELKFISRINKLASPISFQITDLIGRF